MSEIPGIKVTKDLKRSIDQATDIESMRQMLHEAADAQKLTMAKSWEENPQAVNTARFSRDDDPQQRDSSGRFVSTAQQNTEQPRTFSKVETIAGHQMTFNASSAAELETLIAQAKLVADALAPSPEEQQERYQSQRRDDGVRQAELEVKFRTGQISAGEYLEQSGAVDEVLAARGVSVDELRNATSKALTADWEGATTEFLNSAAGSDWPGGEQNMNLMALMISQMGLTDSENKLGALTAAYTELRRNGMLFSVAQPLDPKALDNMTPQEILEASKQAQIERGLDPNQEFVEAYRGGRRDTSSLFGK